MQPQYSLVRNEAEEERARIMEEVTLDIRRRWFGAQVSPFGDAFLVVESGGQMLVRLDAGQQTGDEMVAWAAREGAYVVVTTYSRPDDLAARLRRAGFRPVQRQANYVYDGSCATAERKSRSAGLRSLLTFLRRREPVQVEVSTIGLDSLKAWNAVCWRAFGGRGTEQHSYEEKVRAYQGMAENGRWYLATVDGKPVGTAVLYQGDAAAEILAVGTLPAFRGCGVGTAVMKRAISDWELDGRGFLFLDTTPGSVAEQLYQALGFRQAYLRDVYAPPRP